MSKGKGKGKGQEKGKPNGEEGHSRKEFRRQRFQCGGGKQGLGGTQVLPVDKKAKFTGKCWHCGKIGHKCGACWSVVEGRACLG